MSYEIRKSKIYLFFEIVFFNTLIKKRWLQEWEFGPFEIVTVDEADETDDEDDESADWIDDGWIVDDDADEADDW